MRPPRFITLDGLDGSGKTSQQARLAAWLRERGIDVITCRDPGSTPAGDAVRAILLDRLDLAIAPTTEMLLYMAARAQLVAEVVRPALERGTWVVSDRFLLANVVYQGHAGGLGRDVVQAVGAIATGGITPDLTILIDIDLETAARRLDRPLDRLERRGDDFRRRVRAGFLAEAEADPGRIVVVDGAAAPEAVGDRIRGEVIRRFPDV